MKVLQEEVGLRESGLSRDEIEGLKLIIDEADHVSRTVNEVKLENRLLVERVKKLLSGPWYFEPFKFHALDGSFVLAQNAGLEGFWHTFCDLEHFCGREMLQSQLGWFFPYISALFHEAQFHAEASAFEALQWDAGMPPAEKYSAFRASLEERLNEARAVL